MEMTRLMSEAHTSQLCFRYYSVWPTGQFCLWQSLLLAELSPSIILHCVSASFEEAARQGLYRSDA